MINSKDTRKISPEIVVKMLFNDGITITLDEAKLILDFMYKLANIALDVCTEKMLKDQAKKGGGSSPV